MLPNHLLEPPPVGALPCRCNTAAAGLQRGCSGAAMTVSDSYLTSVGRRQRLRRGSFFAALRRDESVLVVGQHRAHEV